MRESDTVKKFYEEPYFGGKMKNLLSIFGSKRVGDRSLRSIPILSRERGDHLKKVMYLV